MKNKTPLSAVQRLQLIRDVYSAVFNESGSFEEEHIGEDLAYLLGAIALDSHCMWDLHRPILRVLYRADNSTKSKLFVHVYEYIMIEKEQSDGD